MPFKKAREWSVLEIDYLKSHREDPINQLTILLSHSRNAIKNKLAELDGKSITNPNQYSRGRLGNKIGKRKDCNNIAFRSGWEANLYRYLIQLSKDSQNKNRPQYIEYEPHDFTFWQFNIKKGTVSYTPDFKVTYMDGSYEWIEVKGGFLKGSDKTKLRRFKKFFPEEFSHLRCVTPSAKSKTSKFFSDTSIPVKWYYNDLNKQFKTTIPNWE